MGSGGCPKCNSRMEEGFVVDHGHGSSVQQAEWAEGKPVKSFWGMTVKGKRRFTVTTLRCTRCGFLESFAVTEKE
jgi:hypothetical protein